MAPEYAPVPMRGRPGTRDRWRHLPATLIAVGFSLLLVFMVSGSLRPAGRPPPRTPELWPSDPTLANYGDAFALVDLARQMLNSLAVVAIAVPLTVLVASAAGFGLARLPRRARAVGIGISLVALMVPTTALLVSRFTLFRSLGLTGTYVPLIAPALLGTSPFYVLLFTWSFRRIPAELFEAAALEGAGTFTMWRRVAMPLVRPVTAAVAVLSFVVTWSNFLDPLIYLSDPDTYTVPLGLRLLAQLDPSNFPVLLAGAVAATLPVVGAFLLVQRSFLSRFRGAGWLGG